MICSSCLRIIGFIQESAFERRWEENHKYFYKLAGVNCTAIGRKAYIKAQGDSAVFGIQGTGGTLKYFLTAAADVNKTALPDPFSFKT